MQTLNWHHVLRLAALAVATLSFSSQADIRIVATDGAGILNDDPTAAVFIASDANGWDPAGWRHTEIIPPAGDEPGKWVFVIPDFELAGQPRAFKFTRGSWRTVEKQANGQDLTSNRVMNPNWAQFDEMPMTIAAFGSEDDSTLVGNLDFFQMGSRSTKFLHGVRVWTPDNYDENPDKRYPVLYMLDGQNLFDDTTAFAEEWGLDEVVTELAEQGKIDDIIVVGVDHLGTMRPRVYLPMPAGKRAPKIQGGMADQFASFLVTELRPRIESNYRCLTGPENTALGGSSFGGIATLFTAMEWESQRSFGRILVESPSLWIGDGGFMDMLEAFEGLWPERVFMAMGTEESGNPEHAATLVELAEQAEEIIRNGAGAPKEFRFVLDEGGKHDEATWRKRLPEAIEFLFAE